MTNRIKDDQTCPLDGCYNRLEPGQRFCIACCERARADRTLERLPIISDPAIHEALADLFDDAEE